MLMTEADAKEKWCPHARVNSLVTSWDHAGSVVGGAACNRSEPRTMYEQPTCIGSGCMAWRWGDPGIGHRQSVAVNVSSDDYERQGDYFVRVRESCRRGYCGAFGKPEVA